LPQRHGSRPGAAPRRDPCPAHRGARRARRSTPPADDACPLDDAVALFETRVPDLIELDDLLERLGAVDAWLARIVELRFFAGLSIDETARALDISTASVERGRRSARAAATAPMLASRLQHSACSRGIAEVEVAHREEGAASGR
jgi:DNA-directed RNA polymerase specialized sigma24 family protein